MLSYLLLSQKPRQHVSAAEERRYAAKASQRVSAIFMIKRIVLILYFPGYMLVGASSAQAAELDWSKAFQNTESVFSDLNTTSAPGCAVGVVHDGNYIFAKGYGMANLEHNVPIGS